MTRTTPAHARAQEIAKLKIGTLAAETVASIRAALGEIRGLTAREAESIVAALDAGLWALLFGRLTRHSPGSLGASLDAIEERVARVLVDLAALRDFAWRRSIGTISPSAFLTSSIEHGSNLKAVAIDDDVAGAVVDEKGVPRLGPDLLDEVISKVRELATISAAAQRDLERQSSGQGRRGPPRGFTLRAQIEDLVRVTVHDFAKAHTEIGTARRRRYPAVARALTSDAPGSIRARLIKALLTDAGARQLALRQRPPRLRDRSSAR